MHESISQLTNNLRAEILSNPRNLDLWKKLKEEMQPIKTTLPQEKHIIPSSSNTDYKNESIEDNSEIIRNSIDQCLHWHRSKEHVRLSIAFESLKKIAPTHPWSLAIEALIFIDRKSPLQASSMLKEASKQEPSNTWFLFWICQTAILSRSTSDLIRYGCKIPHSEPEPEKIFIALISITLRAIKDIAHLMQNNLAVVYENLIYDLAINTDRSSMIIIYAIINSVEARLKCLSLSSCYNKSILDHIHAISLYKISATLAKNS